MTITLQALSIVEKVEPVQVRFTLRLRDQRSMWMEDGCKIYMIPTWHQMDYISWLLGVFSKTILSRYAASTAAPYPLGFIHLDWDGWILVVQKKAPNWGASSLAWHSCQIKSYEWVCGESLCEVKITCFCNKSWVLLPLLTLLYSPVMEWEIAWLIVCIWREI